jgi:hypothetical protein
MVEEEAKKQTSVKQVAVGAYQLTFSGPHDVISQEDGFLHRHCYENLKLWVNLHLRFSQQRL